MREFCCCYDANDQRQSQGEERGRGKGEGGGGGGWGGVGGGLAWLRENCQLAPLHVTLLEYCTPATNGTENYLILV